MKDQLFRPSRQIAVLHWPTIWRHVLFGALPFLLVVVIYEKAFGEWGLGALVVIIAALLPFVAVGWLGYQHWRYHRKRNPHHG